MIVTFCMFVVHFFLAVMHPLMWQSLISMRYGVVSESYAREHHAQWYYGKERAMNMWEEHQAEVAEPEAAQAQPTAGSGASLRVRQHDSGENRYVSSRSSADQIDQ